MRTQEQIVGRIKEIRGDDVMGFETVDLIEYLDFDHAKEFLKAPETKDDWEYPTKTTPCKKIKDYMAFAWEKANGCRGISAYRTLCHMRAWLWLDEQDEFLAGNDLMAYQHYGKKHLVAICHLYGIDSKQWDDGIRVNEEA